MKEVHFFFSVPMEPRPKKKPQHNTRTGTVYTPKETLNNEAMVREYFHRKYGHVKPTSGPVRMSILLVHRRPKRLMRKKDPAGRLPKITAPDWDNAGKLVSDALEGVVYDNDAQLWDVSTTKVYGAKENDPPHIEVKIWEGEE
jgi:Holliday junction resolvase RusA-like endonuclease